MDGDVGERWGRGADRGHGHASEHSGIAIGSKIGLGRSLGRGRGRGQGQGTTDLGQGRQNVVCGAGSSSSTTVRLAASHNKTSAVRAPCKLQSRPLLSQQKNHKSAAVLSGHTLEPLFVRKHKITIPWCEQIRDYLVNAGFYGLHQIGYVQSDKFLISALVERWRPETHSFHLPVGEMMVTLQDVGLLLGLPIDGEPIYLPEKTAHDWPRMVRKYLGKEVDEQTFYDGSKTAIRITWLKRKFAQPLDSLASEYDVRCYARAYILMIIGSLLFTDVSGGWISAKYLYFLADLSKTGEYSWGSAVLAYLKKELCRACRKDSRQMAGPILLLQLWSWERFPFGRPLVRAGAPGPSLGGPVVELRPPYGYLWSGYHDWTENPARVLSYYRDKLDELPADNVNWEPYVQNLALLPPICTSARACDLWMYTGPVIHFKTVEPHNPRRVMRQFGKHQEVPPNPSRIFNGLPCSYQDKQKKHFLPNWKPNHEEDIKKWRQRRGTILKENKEYNPSTFHEYMTWYSENTILYLQPAKAIGPPPCHPRNLQYQISAGKTHKAAEKIKELKKTAAAKMAEAIDEGTRAFARKVITELKDVLQILGEYDDSSGQLPAQHRVHVPQRQQSRIVGSSSSGVECSRAKRPRGG